MTLEAVTASPVARRDDVSIWAAEQHRFSEKTSKYVKEAEEAKRAALAECERDADHDDDPMLLWSSEDDVHGPSGCETRRASQVGVAPRLSMRSEPTRNVDAVRHGMGAVSAAKGRTSTRSGRASVPDRETTGLWPPPPSHTFKQPSSAATGRESSTEAVCVKIVSLDVDCTEAMRSLKWAFTSDGAVVKQLGRHFETKAQVLGGPVEVGDVLVDINAVRVGFASEAVVRASWKKAQEESEDGTMKLVLMTPTTFSRLVAAASQRY